MSYGVDYSKTTSRNYTLLQEAVTQGKLDYLKILVNAGANVNAPLTNNMTLLHFCRDLETVKYLVETLKMDIHARDKYDRNVLQMTLSKPEILEYLIKKGVDVNQPSKSFYPYVIQSAVLYYPYQTLAVMAEYKADLTVLSNNGDNLLHLAVQRTPVTNQRNNERYKETYANILASCKLLLTHKVDFLQPNFSGETPVHLAVRLENPDLLNLFMSSKNAAGKFIDKETASSLLSYAIKWKKYDIANYLLQKGADPRIKDVYGWDASYYAVAAGNLDLLKQFARTGSIDFTGKDVSGFTVIDEAIFHGNPEIISFFGSIVQDQQMKERLAFSR